MRAPPLRRRRRAKEIVVERENILACPALWLAQLNRSRCRVSYGANVPGAAGSGPEPTSSNHEEERPGASETLAANGNSNLNQKLET